ncbi:MULTISPECIES: monovalent cation/H+ antiporter subunit D [unclassified Guyparkeria]|uniref:monovalent cation/H+ antiporter subunit D n=1 Tax=unclassified Guyparkeria TaxID=2626246 RepID=UPI0008261545|nr:MULTISPECIES: monovalent cation/H+ antiporter subunit D [unclassified Guyparkeria]
MTANLISLLVLLPVALAAILTMTGQRLPTLSRGLDVAGVAVLLAVSAGLLLTGAGDTPQVIELGSWAAPFGIVWVFDRLSGLMLLLTATVALLALVYAIRRDEDQAGPHFHALFQAQLFGLNGAFLTGDLFNLFVFFEVLLLASYGLLLHGNGRKRTRAGFHYVVVNLIGSTLFLFAVGALYGTVGSLNLADITLKLPDVAPDAVPLVTTAIFLLFTVFLIKGAAFPLYLWLPGAYAHASIPVAALFAIMTKVGLYSVLRVDSVMLSDNSIGGLVETTTLIAPWLLWLGLVTLLLAALGVVAARFVRRQVAYLIIASVGTILIALGLVTGNAGEAAIGGALYYWMHTTVLSAGFFLLAGLILHHRPEAGDGIESAPPMPHAILVGSLFFAYAIAMAGLPPLTGFFGKIMILAAALDSPLMAPIFAVILTSGLIMVIALARAGSRLFYQSQATPGHPAHARPADARVALPGVGMAVLPLVLAGAMVVGAQPLSGWLAGTAAQIAASDGYLDAVMPDGVLDPAHAPGKFGADQDGGSH